ncbi:MAG: tRNA (adenosine(37)-N6)-threonylcarbamoyltransferase complex ATPase subunit type 1 TsaE [Planctomycetes bacterium]|nr:tRNA (adenosine(37)-N6)-threonylcarbamoyltransferase complex ATPase subunit type 1 TsaE [Planctomycetota bacterium]
MGERLTPGTVLALCGTLGAGKTVFARGVAAGNRIPVDCRVSSPTFVLVNEYPGILPLFHLDAYRLSGSLELDSLGFDEMCNTGGAVLVEWADRVAESIPNDHLHVELEVVEENCRKLTFTARGTQSIAILESLQKNAASEKSQDKANRR